MFFKIGVAYITSQNAKKLKESGKDFFHREDVAIKQERINPDNIIRYHEYPSMEGKTIMYFNDGNQAILDYSPEEIDEKIKDARLNFIIPN